MTYSFRKTEEFLNDLNYRIGQIITLIETTFTATSNDVFHSQPDKMKWSVIQQLVHSKLYIIYYLNKSEKAFQKAMAQNSQPTFHFENTPKGKAKINSLKANSEGMFKPQKTQKRYWPTSRKVSAFTIAEFLLELEQLQAMIKKAAYIDIQNTKIKAEGLFQSHYNFGDLLEIMVLHTERHIQTALKNMQQKR
jgi:hypothetical protein